jgi:hypothetical protein
MCPVNNPILIHNVIGKNGTSNLLKETAGGMVIIRYGNPPPVTNNQTNCFLFEKEPPVMNEDRKPLSPGQKPTKFFRDFVRLYSSEGEWILSGFGALGKYEAS